MALHYENNKIVDCTLGAHISRNLQGKTILVTGGWFGMLLMVQVSHSSQAAAA
jgi:hypothetical protein